MYCLRQRDMTGVVSRTICIHFIEAGVKVNGRYFPEVPEMQKLDLLTRNRPTPAVHSSFPYALASPPNSLKSDVLKMWSVSVCYHWLEWDK